jgi:hypothetical protein
MARCLAEGVVPLMGLQFAGLYQEGDREPAPYLLPSLVSEGRLANELID